MELLKHASEALQRHLSALLLYLGIAAICSIGSTAVTVYLLRHFAEGELTLEVHIIHVVTFVVASILFAYAQAVVFARIGREMDRPLWKVRDDREALGRFFMMWFEFNLIVNTMFWIATTPFSGDEASPINSLALVATLVGVILLVPFGAAFMFQGRFSWSAFAEGLAPLGRRPMEAAPAFFITFAQFALVFVFSGQISRDVSDARHLLLYFAFQLALNLVIAYLDCLAFAAMWLVCKDDRDSPDEVDLDF